MLPRIICTCCLVFAVIFSVFYLSLNSQPDENTNSVEQTNEQNTSSASNPTKYIVKSNNGKISVFEDGSNEPIHTLDSPLIRDLPEYDQQTLEAGITANNKEELIKILEDYDG